MNLPVSFIKVSLQNIVKLLFFVYYVCLTREVPFAAAQYNVCRVAGENRCKYLSVSRLVQYNVCLAGEESCAAAQYDEWSAGDDRNGAVKLCRTVFACTV